jgi:hypothetical protein
MPTTVRPRGPLPARVYWVRRLIVLGVPLVLVVVIARVLGGSSDGKDASGGQAVQAGETVQTTPAPTMGPTAEKPRKGKKNKNQDQEPAPPPEPVLAEPTGPCTDSDITATPVLTSVVGGADIQIPINLRTTTSEACTWHVSPQTMTVTITSGSDFIWSSRQCPASVPVQDIVVRSAVDAQIAVTWAGGKRSDDTCSGRTDWARPGFYHVESAALGGEGTDIQFELTGTPPAVVTQTADPQPQGGKGKGKNKGKNGDTSHTPGEDGAGNDVG